MSSTVIQPYQFSGSVNAPYSKSYLQRAIAIAVLSDQPTKINGITYSKDAIAALGIARNLGAEIFEGENQIIIIPPKTKELKRVKLNVGEAGLSTRMFAPLATSLYDEVKIDGSGSILNRPMDMVIEALEQLDVNVHSNNNKLPIETKGKIKPGRIKVDGSESSQLLTGLLITLPTLTGDSVIEVKNLKSKPYVDMTLEILSDFGVSIINEGYKVFRIKGNQTPVRSEYTIEGDWSGASFLLVGGAISGGLKITGLNQESKQADRKILEALELAGAKYAINDSEILVENQKLNGFTFDATDCPDLFPPLAILGVFANNVTTLKGVTRLRNKESDRAATIKEEIEKIGGKVELEGDEMKVYGTSISGGKASSRNDHRIAMMLAVLGGVSDGEIEIENPESVQKSFPEFFEIIAQMPLR